MELDTRGQRYQNPKFSKATSASRHQPLSGVDSSVFHIHQRTLEKPKSHTPDFTPERARDPDTSHVYLREQRQAQSQSKNFLHYSSAHPQSLNTYNYLMLSSLFYSPISKYSTTSKPMIH